MRINLKALLFMALVVIAWHAIVVLPNFNRSLFPGPIEVFDSLLAIAFSGELFLQILASVWRLLLGLALGCIVGVFLGLLMGRSAFLDEAASPFLNILRAFPAVAIIPLMIIWFGITDYSKILSIALAVFFPVWVSALAGAKQIPEDYIRTAKLFTKSAKKSFFQVIFPASMPFIVSGTRIAIAIGFIMVFVTELAGASVGLGYFIANAQITYRIDNLLAGLITLGLLAAFTDYAFVFATKKIFPWLVLNEGK